MQNKNDEWKTLKRCYANIISKCYNKNNLSYKSYGAKGIEVSRDWLESFDYFYRDMNQGWKQGYHLDRVNPYGNYCKENCRWIPAKENVTRIRRERYPRLGSKYYVNKTISFRISEELHEELMKHLSKEKMSISDFLRVTIEKIAGDK